MYRWIEEPFILRLKLGLWMIIISMSCIEVMGQRYFVRNYSAKDGLSQSEVGDMVQDDSGRLFITTAASGVDVFDGVGFDRITVEDGLVSPYIGRTHKDTDGNIWFVSTKGLNLYGKDTILSFLMDRAEFDIESIFGIEELAERHFLIPTDNGLVEFKDSSFTIYRNDEIPDLRFFDVLLRADGDILLISDNGLYEFNNGSIEPCRLGGGFTGESLLAICELPGGQILLGTRNGYHVVDQDAGRFVELFEDEAYAVICFLLTSQGTLYAGTNGQGLFIQSSVESPFTRIHEGNGLSDDYTWSLYEDMDANIWIGTSGAGLDLLSAEHFQILNPDGGLQNDIVYDIIQRENGEMWFGMVQGGISVFDGGSYTSFGVEDGLSHLSVRCFHDEGDTLWIGTENGLTIYTENGFEDVSQSYNLGDYALFDIHRARNGAMWFACKGERYYGENGGVVRYFNGKLDHFKKEDGLSSNNVYAILERAEGDILFGTTSGLTRWDGDKLSPVIFPGLSSCHGTSLTMREDGKGNLWIGTVGGLSMMRDDEFICFDNEPGLVGRTIYLLENQGDSIMWVGSSSGLEKLDLDFFYEQDSIRTTLYNDFNGFYGTECNQNAVTKDKEGNYWFGTIKGAVKYFPEKDNSISNPPRIEVTSVNIKGKRTQWNTTGLTLDDAGLPLDLELTRKENSLQIEFIGVDLLEPQALEYSFMLAGAEEDWSEYQQQRSVFYSNLPPGEYTFRVRSKDLNTGLVSEPAVYKFSIIPAYFQTLWFKIIASLLILIAALAFFFWRIKSIRRHEAEQRNFQHQLAELEMTALRSQMNPHFLFNSLNSVNNFIIKNKKEEASEYLTKFSRLVRMVLQNSKEKLVSLENELTALRLYIQMESLRFKNDFNYVEKISEKVDLTQHFIPPLLLQPYVENAIWHGLLHLTDRHGKLTVELDEVESGIKVVIKDNGVGREKSEMMKSKTAMKKKSMGMKINADRMGLSKNLYDFDIDIELTDLKSSEGVAEGTMVTIIIADNE